MIQRAFREPNFICEVEDRHGNVVEEIHTGDAEAEVRARLDKRVKNGLIRSVVSVKPYDFKKWRKRSTDATTKALNAFAAGPPGDFSFSTAVWSDLKEHLQELFNGKCAYCEADFQHVAWGDVEHFRPKKKVTDDHDQPIMIAAGKPHPGYYWLAYDVTNLLPSCQLCNQAPAKLNQFPLQDESRRASSPDDDLTKEKPLLLNPYKDEPRKHLKFIPSKDDTEFGTVAPASEQDEIGKASIEVYTLNRPSLIERRREEQAAARRRIKEALMMENPQALAAAIAECELGVRQFSSAALAEISAYLEKMNIHIDQ